MERSPTEFLELAVVDNDLIWDGLASVFAKEGLWVHAFADSRALLASRGRRKPQCVIVEADVLPGLGLDGLATLTAAYDAVPVFLMSAAADIPMAVAAIKAGAYDIIKKPFVPVAVIERVKEAVRKRTPTGRVIPWLTLALSAGLTARELDVLQQLVAGASNKAAALVLSISPRTVEVHRANLMEKMGARNTADLMRIVLA